MKTFATLLLTAWLALPAHAAVIHDEGVDGDLSGDQSAPTSLAFFVGSNTIIGSVVGGPDNRDYITFTIPPGRSLVALNLVGYSTSDIGFASFNTGTTSFIPGAGTNALFLSGIHITDADVGLDLLPLFVSRAVTTNALATPSLGAGDYCFLIQQTSGTFTEYELEFVFDSGTPVEHGTWGAIKALYR